MKALNGVLFYNSGPDAGASESHKHLQVLPFDNIPGKKLPINQKIMEALKRNGVDKERSHLSLDKFDQCILPEYQEIRHTVCSLDSVKINSINNDYEFEEASRMYLSAYQ